MTTTKVPPFGITLYADQSIYPKIATYSAIFERTINKTIALDGYSPTLQHLYFGFIAVPADNPFHKEQQTYHPREHSIELLAKLDFNQVREAAEEAILPLLAACYLNALNRCATIVSIETLNIELLKNKLRRVFKQKGWGNM